MPTYWYKKSIIFPNTMTKKRKIIITIISVFSTLALLLILFIMIFLTKYGYIKSGDFILSQTVPKTDIVYDDPSSDSLGYINADGTGISLVEFRFNFRRPDVSKDGNYIYGIDDQVLSHSVYWDIKNRRYFFCNPDEWGADSQVEGIEDPDHPEYALVDNNNRIFLLDIKKCTIIKIIVEFGTETNGIKGISYNTDTKELLYGIMIMHYYHDSENHLRSTAEYQINKLNLTSNENKQIAVGINPSWSPDGSQISFTGLNGLYVMNADGTNKNLIFSYPFEETGFVQEPYMRWSPDGKWLVYHFCDRLQLPKSVQICLKTPVYKIQSTGGIPIQILDNGEYPFWFP